MLGAFSHSTTGRCTLRNAEFRKGVFCGISPAERSVLRVLHGVIDCAHAWSDVAHKML